MALVWGFRGFEKITRVEEFAVTFARPLVLVAANVGDESLAFALHPPP
jgi:hypothetical protein